jgi:hypothetical protein
MKRVLLLAGLLGCLVAYSAATVITFDAFVSPGGSANISDTTPYTESGYTLTPVNADSAIFSATSGPVFYGRASDWFGFEESNPITLTGPAPFDLDSLWAGPSSIGAGTVTFTVVGNLFGGGTVSATFTDLTTATLLQLDFTNLSSVTFSATDDAGIDDITVNSGIPEPTTMLLLATGLLAISVLRHRRTSRR